MLRDNTQVGGISRGGRIHKLFLYADDLILYLLDPDISIPMALRVTSEFGKISGYKINLMKSILFPINEKARLLSYETYPLKVTKDSFTYLGVSVTHKYEDLFKHNFKPALEKAKLDLTRWSTLPYITCWENKFC